MARKKGADAPDDESQQAKGSEVTRVISGPKLKKLMASKRRAVQDTSTINGEFGAEIKDAEENHHFHRPSGRWIFQLDRMEPEKLREHMDQFFYMYEASGLKKRAESVMRMPLEDGESEDEDNVRKFPAAAE